MAVVVGSFDELAARQPITAHVTAIVRDRRFITVRNAGGAGPAPSSGSRSRAPSGRSRR